MTKKSKRKILSILPAFVFMVAILFFSPITAKAETKKGSCGENVTYSYDTETKELTISGTGPMKDYNSTNVPWRDYSVDIKTVKIEYGVTRIGDAVFGYTYHLTDITIPNSVTSIGYMAFEFSDITNITIPNSVTSIESKAFFDCENLKSIEIPESVTNIGYESLGYGYFYDSYNNSLDKLPGFTIISTAGSAAEIYANDNNFYFVRKEGGRLYVNVPEGSSVTYDGYEHSGVIENENFYTITGNTAKDAGTYTAKLSLKPGVVWSDNSTADKEVQWTINPRWISAMYESVTIQDQIYSGLPLEPTPTFNPSQWAEEYTSYSARVLKKDTDYTVSYANNTNIGMADVTITGKGNFIGTVNTKFAIYPASIDSASVTIPDQEYTGKELTPKPTVKCGSVTLVEGIDYTVSYSNNIDIGTANVIIEGKGNFKGSLNTTFSIVEKLYSVKVSNDGNGTVSANITSGKPGTEVTLTVAPKEGYQFKEWQVVSGGVTVADNKFTIGTADVEVKAIFEKIQKKFSVSFDANGGSGTMTGVEVTEGSEYTLPNCTFTAPEGKVFDKWDKGAVGDKMIITADTAIKALWKDKTSSTTTDTPDTTPDSDKTDTPLSETKKGDTVTDKSSKASYTVTSTGKTLTVTYNKSTVNNATTINIPATVKIGDKTYKVTEIKANAFKNNKKLKKITIGKNIKRIGKNAFYGCKNLKNVTIKTTLLTKKTVGKNAFKGINAKAKVKVPKKKLKVYKPILKKAGIKGKKQKITK